MTDLYSEWLTNLPLHWQLAFAVGVIAIVLLIGVWVSVYLIWRSSVFYIYTSHSLSKGELIENGGDNKLRAVRKSRFSKKHKHLPYKTLVETIERP